MHSSGYESKKEIIQHLLPWPGEVRAGQVFTWGRGSHGQLGHEKKHPKVICAIPYPVPNLKNVIWVACGGGQQGCTACVTSIGEVLTWGNNSGYRLGHLDLKTTNERVRKPKLIKHLKDPIIQVECGLYHMLALSRKGSVYAGGTNKAGALGLGIKDTQHIEHKPVLISGTRRDMDKLRKRLQWLSHQRGTRTHVGEQFVGRWSRWSVQKGRCGVEN